MSAFPETLYPTARYAFEDQEFVTAKHTQSVTNIHLAVQKRVSSWCFPRHGSNDKGVLLRHTTELGTATHVTFGKSPRRSLREVQETGDRSEFLAPLCDP